MVTCLVVVVDAGLVVSTWWFDRLHKLAEHRLVDNNSELFPAGVGIIENKPDVEVLDRSSLERLCTES